MEAKEMTYRMAAERMAGRIKGVSLNILNGHTSAAQAAKQLEEIVAEFDKNKEVK